MGRRKQAKPIKRTPEEYEIAEMEPSAKMAKETSATQHSAAITVTVPTQDDAELSPSCSKDPASTDPTWNAESIAVSAKKPSTNPLLMLEKSLKRFEPRKSQPDAATLIFVKTHHHTPPSRQIRRPRNQAPGRSEDTRLTTGPALSQQSHRSARHAAAKLYNPAPIEKRSERLTPAFATIHGPGPQIPRMSTNQGSGSTHPSGHSTNQGSSYGQQ
ncbi:hypothetical protein OSTOST_02706 [Ostertagia ostertagi]